MMQLNIFPSGIIAILISSAVVPGAKFDAWTTNGPAEPLIENPEAWPRMFALRSLGPFLGPLGIRSADGPVGVPCRAAKSRLFCRERAIAGERVVGSFETRDGLFWWWRSWTHFPLGPVGGAEFPIPLPEAVRCEQKSLPLGSDSEDDDKRIKQR